MRRSRPLSVWVAIGALSVVVVAQAALALWFARSGEVGWGMYAFAGLLWLLLVVGLARGARLAWLWGRYLTVILGIVMAATVVLAALRHELHGSVLALGIGGLALPLFTAGIALGRRSAYAFFDLVCPACSARTGLGADFLFHQARCRHCDHVW
jgi:hypothetical protein